MTKIERAYDFVVRKDMDALAKEFEDAMASFGARLTNEELTRRQAVGSVTEYADAQVAVLRKEMIVYVGYLSQNIDAAFALLEQANKRRFTVRLRRLFGKLSWTRRLFSSRVPSISSSSPARSSVPTDSDTEREPPKPSGQFTIF